VTIDDLFPVVYLIQNWPDIGSIRRGPFIML
jgi:hypothetical protein